MAAAASAAPEAVAPKRRGHADDGRVFLVLRLALAFEGKFERGCEVPGRPVARLRFLASALFTTASKYGVTALLSDDGSGGSSWMIFFAMVQARRR